MRALLALILTMFFFTTIVWAAPPKRIAEVRYVGLSNIGPRDLEGRMPFALGDIWNKEFVSKGEAAIIEYYAKRGFYKVKTGITLQNLQDDKVSLLIRIDEGSPCIVRSLSITEPPGFKSKNALKRFKEKMDAFVKLSVGDRYDEEKLTEHLRELREWLVAENYIVANTDEVKLTYSGDQTQVDVQVAVDYGDRVTFGFQGNSVFTKGDLNDFIASVRATGLGKDYVGVIQRRFTEEYRSRAYNDVKIDTIASEKTFSKHITFYFQEKLRTELVDVKWEGLSDSNVKLATEAFNKGVSRLVQRGYYVEKDIDKGILVVLEDLKSRGYLSSKLIAKSVQPVKAPPSIKRVQVLLQIAEGEQTAVGETEIKGNTHFSVETILTTLEIAHGKPFNPFAFEEGIQRLRSLYIAEGFLDFKILTKDEDIVVFSENNRGVQINLALQEGPRIKIGDIHIKGLEKTKEYIVSREITVKPEDWWMSANLQETEQSIRTLGLFSEVRLRPEASKRGPDFRDLIIQLKEAEPGALEVGPGFRSDLGLRAFSRVSYNNILGRNWMGSLSAEGNRRISDFQFVEYKFDSSFVEPRFFGTKNLYTIGVSTKKQRFPSNFNASTTKFVTGFERRISKIISAKLLYQLERIRQFDVIIDGQKLNDDNRSMLIGSIVPSITLDTRDNPFTTTQGWLLNGSLEYAHPDLSGQRVDEFGAHGYQKWTASLRRYTSITKDIVWSNVIAGGFARSNIAGREIPLIKLFRLGGYSTIRGFSEDAINVDSTRITGTLTFLNLRTQVEVPLVGDLKLAPFLDAGNLYIDNFGKRPFFRAGAGVGLHYMTPVGPINLDWGQKLNSVGGDSPNQLHFSVGLI